MGDSQSGEPNRWQSLWQFLKSHFLTEFAICVLSLVLAATLLPGAFGGLRLVLGHLWIMVLIVVVVLMWIIYALWCAWDFVTGNDPDESIDTTD